MGYGDEKEGAITCLGTFGGIPVKLLGQRKRTPYHQTRREFQKFPHNARGDEPLTAWQNAGRGGGGWGWGAAQTSDGDVLQWLCG
jgi:hypothetical protein